MRIVNVAYAWAVAGSIIKILRFQFAAVPVVDEVQKHQLLKREASKTKLLHTPVPYL